MFQRKNRSAKKIKPAGIFYFIKLSAYIGIICCSSVIIKLLFVGHPYLNNNEMLFVRIIIMCFFPIPFGIIIYFLIKFKYIIFYEDEFEIGFLRQKKLDYSKVLLIKNSIFAKGIYPNLLVIKIKIERKNKFYYFMPSLSLEELKSFIKLS